jgi:hypothetical protein
MLLSEVFVKRCTVTVQSVCAGLKVFFERGSDLSPARLDLACDVGRMERYVIRVVGFAEAGRARLLRFQV